MQRDYHFESYKIPINGNISFQSKHTHPIILLILNGEGSIILNRISKPINSYDEIIIYPNDKYVIKNNGNCRLEVLEIKTKN